MQGEMGDMNDTLAECLDDLEKRIDPVEEDRLFGQWVDFALGRFEGKVFSPKRQRRSPARVEWPTVRVNEALVDVDLMCLQQYAIASERLATGTGAPLSIRANYGTSIIPMLFGAEPFIMPDETDTLPTTVPLGSADKVRRLVDAGIPELTKGWGARVFETGERFLEIAREYARIGRHVHMYHPDAQGPLDICEVLWGSEIFLAIYDEAALVKELLDLVTETYIAFMKKWMKIAPFRSDCNVHWDLVHKGAIMLRADSAMNISPAQYEEFAAPYDERLLEEFGSGAIHFCGRGEHFIKRMCELEGVTAVNLSQPELNDMEVILSNTVDQGINLIDLAPDAARAILASGRATHGRLHCRGI